MPFSLECRGYKRFYDVDTNRLLRYENSLPQCESGHDPDATVIREKLSTIFSRVLSSLSVRMNRMALRVRRGSLGFTLRAVVFLQISGI